MADHEVMHIAIIPPEKLDERLVRNVATVINKSPYDTNLLLAGEIPRIIAHYDSITISESVIRNLSNLGLVAIACRDSELRQSPPGFRAQTLEFKEKEVLLRDRTSREKREEGNNIFLIIKGRIQTSVEAATTKSKTKFSLSRTLLTGGIPIWRKVDEKSKERATQNEYFARLYARKSPEPFAEILQHHMDYSFLGAKIAASSLINFGNVIQKLREMFPQAIFDDTLVKPYSVNACSSGSGEDIEIKCNLIYLFHTLINKP